MAQEVGGSSPLGHPRKMERERAFSLSFHFSGVSVVREPPASRGLQGEVLPLRSCTRGAASAMRDGARSTKLRASAQGGPVPPEERVATLASSEGPTSYRLVGVATRDEAGGSSSEAPLCKF